jgi:flavodoxin
MKTLIAYHSKTGNTKKIAEAIRTRWGGTASRCCLSRRPRIHRVIP